MLLCYLSRFMISILMNSSATYPTLIYIPAVASISVHLFSCRISRYRGAESLYMPCNSISSAAGVAEWQKCLTFSEQSLKKILVVSTVSDVSFPLFKYNTFYGNLLRTCNRRSFLTELLSVVKILPLPLFQQKSSLPNYIFLMFRNFSRTLLFYFCSILLHFSMNNAII